MNDAIKLKQLFALADILMDTSFSEEILTHKLNAYYRLNSLVKCYLSMGTLPSLVETIWDKKWHFIKEATTSAEIATILKPSIPKYSYGEWSPSSPYHVDEEELLYWSVVSPHCHLMSVAEKRYMALFKKCLPEISKELNL